jgi:tetratricopeptide (TPR) repeat protein
MPQSTEVVESNDRHVPLDALSRVREALHSHPPGDPDGAEFLTDLGDSLRTHLDQLGDPDALAKGIELFREALSLRPPGHPNRSDLLNNLGTLLQLRFQQLGDVESLAESYELHRQALDLRPQGHTHRSYSLNKFANALQIRYDQLGDLDALAEAVELHRQALAMRPPGHPLRSTSLNNLAKALQSRSMQLGDLDALVEAVDLYREALYVCPQGHPFRLTFLYNLANALQFRFEQMGNMETLAEAVELHRQALDLRPQGDPLHSSSLNDLANALQTRFEQLGDLDALAEAVGLHRQALALRPQGHPLRLSSLNNLANALQSRFKALGDLEALAGVVDMYHEALDLCPQGHPLRSTSLNNLAIALKTCFGQMGNLETLAQAVDLHRQALNLRPPGHPDRSRSLNNLADALQTRFSQLGDLDSLAEAVNLHRQALALRPPGHPDRSNSMNNLANALQTQSKQLSNPEALADAVELYREALNLRPTGHPDRHHSLTNLANALQTRFQLIGDMGVLAEAVELHYQALDLCPPGHLDRSMSLNNLATSLQTRFKQLGDLDALAEAVELHRQALDLRPHGHPDRSSSLINLANALLTRFQQLGDMDSLAEGVGLHRQALDLRPRGHPDHSMSLSNLAYALRSRFKQLGDLDALAEAVDLHRQALSLRPQGHPNRIVSLRNLADTLCAQSRTASAVRDDSVVTSPIPRRVAALNEALSLYTEGLRLCHRGHPERIKFLFDIGVCLIRPGTHLHNFADGIRYILEALRDPASSAQKAVGYSTRALPSLETGYRFSIEQMNTGRPSQHEHHDLLLEVYTLVIQLLPRAASFGLDHAERLCVLSGAEAISGNAAARAIAAGRDSEAVEMLEEGRGVFWSQALRLRTTELDCLPIEDAQELRRLFQTLETGSVRDDSMSKIQREQHIEARRRLSNAAEDLITDIRSRPGMSRFLLPPAFSSLVQSLPEVGYVVILVASDLGHRALVLDRANGITARLELVPPEGGFFSEEVKNTLPRDANPRYSMEYTNVSRPFGISGRTKQIETDPLNRALAQLWTVGYSTRDLPLLETGYRFSIEQMNTVRPSQHEHHDLLLEAYTLVIQLLPRAASFGLDHAERLRVLSGAEAISRNAATRAIAAGRDTEAVEMLEEGRGVFWSQALRLRTTELDRLPMEDAQELRRIFQTLETGSVRDDAMSRVQREQHLEARRRLSNAAEDLITDIRARPEMSRFLLPPAFSSLVQSLPEVGFIVILVASDLGHRALVLDRAGGNTSSLELVPPEGGFFSQEVKNTLPRDANPKHSMEHTNVSRPFGISGRTKQTETDPLNRTLAQLWTLIVWPVIEVLGLKVCP